MTRPQDARPSPTKRGARAPSSSRRRRAHRNQDDRESPPEEPGRAPPAPGAHLALGEAGESQAARLLEAKGYRIEARNVRAGGVEMDLIARRGPLIVFVEVKTRRTQRFGPPEGAVDAAKQARLLRGAAAWLAEHPARGARIRFDVIALCLREGAGSTEWRSRHIEGAFDAS